jgi:RNA-directed DNA polymerase
MENSGAPSQPPPRFGEHQPEVKKFLALTSGVSLSEFLRVDDRKRRFLTRALRPSLRYQTFEVLKKNGGTRTIESPTPGIKSMQRRLGVTLTAYHRPRKAVFAFASGRNVVGNARQHIRRRWVFNIDLENFFHSIHFGRIVGLFNGPRFNFSTQLSQELAQLCTHEGRLPQGAPTSPVLSNLVCDHLDASMISFAKQHRCTYTRYCDDITFSTNMPRFPAAIAATSATGAVEVAGPLRKIIEDHRFKINDRKTRLRSQRERQDVTGLTVNTKVNVSRAYIRRIRAMLHAWEKYGEAAAQAEFSKRWDQSSRRPRKKPPDFRRVLRGRIAFLGIVRGNYDPIHVRFLRHFVRLEPGANSKVLLELEKTQVDVFLCHASEDKPSVVQPIADALTRAGIRYFLDAKEILWGDSVTNVINRALVQARFVLVVISARSLEKHWPTKEMNAALAREISTGSTAVLPLLVAPTAAERQNLWNRLALQGDKLYLEWSDDPAPIVSAVQALLAREGIVNTTATAVPGTT